MPAFYRAYGLCVCSAVPLPFNSLPLPPQDVDVTVRLGAVPVELPGRDTVRSAMWQARPDAFLMEVEGVARYLVEGGRNVTVAPLGGDDADVAAFLANTPFTVLLQRRGVLTLHGASVATDQGAVLLLGRSGIGKSSLAAALVERGSPLIADDVTGIAIADERVLALPASTSLRLWADTLEQMRWRGRGESRMRRGVEKYLVAAQRSCAEPMPVRTVFVLTASASNVIGIEPVSERDALSLLWSNTHRRYAMDAIGKGRTRFRAVAAMAHRVPVALVTRPHHPFLLDALADRIQTACSMASPSAPPAQPFTVLPAPPAEKTQGSRASSGSPSGCRAKS